MDDKFLFGRRILVVEDEMLVLIAIVDMLAELGCTAITLAGNIDKALSLIETQEFDLATLDINLNGKRSYPVAEALSEHGVPFLFSTGYGEAGVIKDFASQPVLTKPYTGPQLVSALAALLGPAMAARCPSSSLGVA